MRSPPVLALHRCLLAGLLGWAAAVLAACGSAPEPPRIFTMELADIPLPREPRLAGTLQVQSLSSATVYADRRLAWRDMGEPQQIRLYNQFLWSSAPPRLFQEQLFRCLAGAQAADAVIPNSVAVAIDYALSGEIERLELQLGAQSTKAALQVTLYLTNRRTRELLWTRNFSYLEPLFGRTPEDTASAFSEAMTKLCYDSVTLLRETAAARQ